MIFEGEIGCSCDADWERAIEAEVGFVNYDPEDGIDDWEDMQDPEPDPGSDDGDAWGEDGRP